MCTVTYLPVGNSQFILTSNRDEQIHRMKAFLPQKYLINRQVVFYPKDMQAGSTWIASGINTFTLCLLNGAYQKHVHQPPYSKSRGIMLLDLFYFKEVTEFARNYNFTGIEPFTLLVLNHAGPLQLHELRWDGNTAHLIEKNALQPAVWSSVILYEPNVINQRQQWFNQWLLHYKVNDQDAIDHFHQFGGIGDKSIDLMMNRDQFLRTLSITSVSKLEDGMKMKYKDVIDDQLFTINFN